MIEITVTEARRILNSSLIHGELPAKLAQKTDEELLRTDLQEEFGFDSSDFVELLIILHNLYGIYVDDIVICNSDFREKPTVENFVKVCNNRGHYL